MTMCPSDLYMYAVLVCCVGILSVLLFTLVIAWQSVFHKRKSRGKETDKVMSGMGNHPHTGGRWGAKYHLGGRASWVSNCLPGTGKQRSE